MKNFGRNFDWWKNRAEQSKADNASDSDTYMNLANMYFEGDGVEQDYKKAFEWYEYLSNESDNDDYSMKAKIMMAIMYYLGKGVKCNYDKAYELAKQVNEKDYTSRTKKIDTLNMIVKGISKYESEDFVENILDSMAQGRSLSLARDGYVKWYQDIADSGNYDAYYELGCLYENGRLAEKDFKKAKECYKIVAEKSQTEWLVIMAKNSLERVEIVIEKEMKQQEK